MKKIVMTMLAMVLATGMQAQNIEVLQNGDTIVDRKEVKLHKEAFYKIRESLNVENSHNYVLREVAEFMQKYSDTKVTLTGYADKGTGNAKLNEMYAMNRAMKFKNDLVSRYGIAPDRIIADSKGDTVQPFAENDKNRCVIVDGVGYELIIHKKRPQADNTADLLRRQAQEDKQRRYHEEMARQAVNTVDTVYVHTTDTLWLQPEEAMLKPESPFGLNKQNRWHNWFVSLGVGPGIFQGDHNVDAPWKDRIYPAFNFAIGKWVYPALGFRARANLDVLHSYYNAKAGSPNELAPLYGEFVHGASPKEPFEKCPWLYRMEYNAWNFDGEVMVNFSSFIWSPYNRRIWNLIGYAGVGCIATWDNGARDWFNYATSWNVGILNAFRISEHFDINLDLHLKKFDDDFNCFRQGRGLDGITNLTIGGTWYFTKRGF